MKEHHGEVDDTPPTRQYYYLYDYDKKHGTSKAKDYMETLRPLLSIRFNAELAGGWNQLFEGVKDENVLTKVAASFVSIFLKPTETFMNIGVLAESALWGNEKRDYAYYNGTGTIREGVSSGMSGLGKFGYDSLMNAADNFLNRGISVVCPALGLGMMGVQAATDTTIDCANRGMSDAQCLSIGVLAGVAEVFFEKVSLDKYLKVGDKAKAAGWLKTWLKELPGVGAVEASEEIFTEIANILADTLIGGDKSNNQLAIREYMQEHPEASDAEAVRAMLIGNAKQIGEAGLSGALMGIMGGGTLFLQYGSTAWYIKSQYRGETLTQLRAMAENVGGKSLEYANELMQQDKVSKAELADLFYQIKLETKATIKDGYKTEDAKTVAAKIARGETITEAEAQTIVDEGVEKFNAATGAKAQTAKEVMIAANGSPRNAAATGRERFDYAGRGIDITTEEGQAEAKRIYVPSVLTDVSKAEQERTNMRVRTTFMHGGVEYRLSGMESFAETTDEQKYNALVARVGKLGARNMKAFEALAKALNHKLILHDDMTMQSGYVDADGNIHFAINSPRSVVRVAAHELTHWMQKFSKDDYDKLRTFLVNDVGQERFDKLVALKKRQYYGQADLDQVADDEAVAELCERMLADKSRIERFAEYDMPLAQRIRAKLLEIKNAISKAMRGPGGADFGESASAWVKDAQGAFDIYLEGLANAAKNAEARQVADTAKTENNAVQTRDTAQEQTATQEQTAQQTDAAPAGEVRYMIATHTDKNGKKVKYVRADGERVLKGNNAEQWGIQIENWISSIVEKDGKLSLATLVRQIIERITVDSKEQITVSFGYGVDIPIAIS